ncbi:dienelactone hydrolase family protein [Sphingomonas jatrophae]|uniref:Carboxymethylenebutenolidase n=1 Tax=Sphingomonas jatrophae TaxID=1166337 RepID=A0A1I6M1A0_9SPHN|nr:dienelactone hydrolase family protein [Sphingomonas jatrophae]SFS09262.1 carboxymethylenebutenolidase [Sphingomonas jatrophae]
MDHLTRPEGTLAEDLHLTRRAAASLLVGGYAVAALSAEAKPVQTPAEGLVIDEPRLPNGTAEGLPAYVARPAGTARHGAIVVINEIFGLHEYIKDVCRRLAKAGYVAVAPDFFYRSGVDLPNEPDRAKIMAVVGQASEPQVDGDVRATTAWLKSQRFVKPAAIGITGYCWGGTVVWRAAMTNGDIRAGVAWYGRLAPVIPRAAELRAPVLGLYGGEDKGIPLTDVEAMRAAVKAAKRPGEIVVYPGAPHGFHADYRDSYTPAAATDGWKRLLAFFRAHGVA